MITMIIMIIENETVLTSAWQAQWCRLRGELEPFYASSQQTKQSESWVIKKLKQNSLEQLVPSTKWKS